MITYMDAIYHGDVVSDYPYVIHRTYPLAVKTRWWSKRVSVYRREGYHHHMRAGSFHEFSDWDSFLDCWQILKVEEEE